MNQPIITERIYYQLSKDMIEELKSVYKVILYESIYLINSAIYNGIEIQELQNRLEDLFDVDVHEDMEHLSTVNKAVPKRTPSKAMSWAELKGKYGWKGKKYGSLIKKILIENQNRIAVSVLNTDKKRFEKNVSSILPKTSREKIVDITDISNVIRNSTSLIKAADKGELMNQARREDMRKIIQSVVSSEKIDTRGKVKKTLAKKVEKKLQSYFESYTKNSPPYGVPKNLHSIAVTETRSLINNVRQSYMTKVDLGLSKEGYEMTKTWRQNKSLSKTPRKSHSKLDGKTININDKFELITESKQVFRIKSPHDYSLPPEETITCNCDCYYKIRKKRK